LSIFSFTYSYSGPNISLLNSTYYSEIYRLKVLEKYNECCSKKKEGKILIDDAAYFILKNKIQMPILITYSSYFGDHFKLYRDLDLQYSIARCTVNSYVFSGDGGVPVEGGYGPFNICFRKIHIQQQ
jgi:hypothetical protein